MSRQGKITIVCLWLLLGVASSRADCDADELCNLIGYTVIACSQVVGDFEGADFDLLVELDNGMIFRFQEYHYTYSYRPSVAVFARDVLIGEQKLRLYKLLIDDYLYDATRVR